jgi:hypothetical protein
MPPASATFNEESCSSFERAGRTVRMLLKATRGPSYPRLAESQRAGAVEIPDTADSAADRADRQAGTRHDAVIRLLYRWRAPVLSDEEIETYAKIFLMKPGHEFVPFFLWIDDAMRASAHRR